MPAPPAPTTTTSHLGGQGGLMAQNCNRFYSCAVTSQDVRSRPPSSGSPRGAGDRVPCAAGARPDRHRRPRRGVRRPAGAGPGAGSTAAPRSSAARSAPRRRRCRTSSASTSPTSATCSTTWTSASATAADLDAHACSSRASRSRSPSCSARTSPRLHEADITSTGARRRRRRLPALEIVDSPHRRLGHQVHRHRRRQRLRGLLRRRRRRRARSRSSDPRDVDMTLTINGEEVATGNGAAVPRRPARRRCAGWPCRRDRFGDPLRAGHVILSGAWCPFVPFAPGDRVEAIRSAGFAPS